MELEVKDLFCYKLLEEYAKNVTQFNMEDSIFNQWVEDIKRDAPKAWDKAKEKYNIFPKW